MFRRYAYSYGLKKNGYWPEQWYKPEVDEQEREASRRQSFDRRQSRKAKIAEVKLERGCADCGYNQHAAALDFDHLPGTEKLFNIGSQLMRTWESILAEIDKCEVVCANCHRIRTAERGYQASNVTSQQSIA